MRSSRFTDEQIIGMICSILQGLAADPQVWLTDTLNRIADHKITRLDELLPWRYAASAA